MEDDATTSKVISPEQNPLLSPEWVLRRMLIPIRCFRIGFDCGLCDLADSVTPVRYGGFPYEDSPGQVPMVMFQIELGNQFIANARNIPCRRCNKKENSEPGTGQLIASWC